MESKTNNRKPYSFDEYREEIKSIVTRNKKRIKITDILNDCGISRGNYYTFLSGGKEYNGRITSTLSYEKLDRLLKALRAADCYTDYAARTNRKKMELMSDKMMAEYLEQNLLSDPDAAKIDVLKWLKSVDPKAVYKDTNE